MTRRSEPVSLAHRENFAPDLTPMTQDLHRGHVYIVDPDPRTRTACAGLLQSLGYEIREFANGRGFLDAIDTGEPGCVVLESTLGDMTGAEVQSHLSSLGSPIAVVFVTRHGDVASAVASIRAGAAHYLIKPVREQQLLDVVNRAMRRSLDNAGRARARRAIVAHLASLTTREREVLAQLVEGAHYDRVSDELGITKRTVEAHRRRIMEKMGARSLPQLIDQLAQVGWLKFAGGQHSHSH
jgi:two-component system response regulator TtrR